MSRLNYTWWPYVRNMVRAYPKRERCDTLLRVPQMEQNAVKTAIEKTRQRPDGEHRVKLIELVYMQRGRITMQQAAMKIPTSYGTARRWSCDFFLDVAEALGIYDPPEE